jgi:hypothetical protein
MAGRSDIFVLSIGIAWLAASTAADAQAGQSRPPRFQAHGWVSICSQGSDGFAAECEAVKKAGGYTLRLSVADAQFAQFVEHPECKAASNRTLREDAPQIAGARQERWTRGVFGRLSREMQKRCPRLQRLDPASYRHPPALNSAGESDVR